MPELLSLKACSYVSRLSLQGQYDAMPEVEQYAQGALDRGVSPTRISSETIRVLQGGFTRGLKADVIQHHLQAALEELSSETHHV